MTETFPSGFACNVTIGLNGEPLIALAFLGEEGEASSVILTEQEADLVHKLLLETIIRAAVVRETTTMFPEQRDSILENLTFRWNGGEIDG